MNTFAAIVLFALVAVAVAAPVEQNEIAQLSKLMPCKNEQAGSRVRHPGSEHKFLRCVSRDSFWIETCPDNLFYNAELDLCDWSVITRTTTEGPDVVVKFRPVLFRRNKTVVTHHRPRRPLDLSRVSVKVDQESQMFPGQEDIVDTLTPVRTGFGSKSSFTSRPNMPSNSFTHFKEQEEEEKSVDPSEFTALPSKKMTEKMIEKEEEPIRMETTTERVFTTTERPVIRTTTERPVIIRRPVEVRPVEKEEEIVMPREEEHDHHEHHREHQREHHREHHHREHHHEEIIEEEVPEEDQTDKSVLIRHGNIVRVTPPKKFVENRRRPVSDERFEHENREEFVRRPVEQVFEEVPVRHEEIIERRPVEEVIQAVPVKEEVEFTTARTPVFTATRGTFEGRTHHKVPSRTQLFKELAEEIPGARVVSFNGKSVEQHF